MTMFHTLLVISALALAASATPSGECPPSTIPSPNNMVWVTDQDNFCMIMPMDPHTNIVESERLGRTKTYCSQGHRCNPQMQGQLPPDFWTNVNLERGNGTNGADYVQLTGCIRPEKLSRLNPSDDGGQYSSSGNPTGSACLGYNHYVQLVEPNAARACIRCCKDERDCPTDKANLGCSLAIPGEYFECSS